MLIEYKNKKTYVLSDFTTSVDVGQGVLKLVFNRYSVQ